jgi:hypothetical protein
VNGARATGHGSRNTGHGTRSLAAAATLLLFISGTAWAQRGGGGSSNGRDGQSTTFTLKLFPKDEVVAVEKLEKALGALPDVADVTVDTTKRRVTLTWKKKELDDVVKLESTCLKAGCPAILWQPLRIVATGSGGKPGELVDALGLVTGVRKVDALPGGAIVWAEPTLDLDALGKAAADVKASLSITTHEQFTFTYEGDVDAGSLDIVPGVVRIDVRDGTMTALVAKGWSAKSSLVARAKKAGVTLTEKKK